MVRNMRLIKNIMKYSAVFLAGVYIGHGGCSRKAETVKPVYEIKENYKIEKQEVLERIVKDESKQERLSI